MPWSVDDVDKHKKGLSDKQKKTWVKVANGALARCEKKKGSDCEGSAIRQANSVVGSEAAMAALDHIDDITQLVADAYTVSAEFRGSTDEFTNRVRTGFYDRFSKRVVDMPAESSIWVRDVLVDDPTFGNALVVDSGSTLYVVAYEEKDDKVTFVDRDEWKEVVLAYKPVTERMGEGLTERASGGVVGLVESEDGKGPLYVDLIPIRPGWGNSRDNHYYTAEAVKGAAAVWKGAKMYATDHVQEEKNVLTEVSEVVESPVSHTEDGIPVVRAAVINPLFADVIRMRQATGILGNLECSIVARGLVEKEEFEDPETGRTGHRVTEILADDAGIDWVTRAGAGGRALAIAESELTDYAHLLEQAYRRYEL